MRIKDDNPFIGDDKMSVRGLTEITMLPGLNNWWLC
jgi:hypothetical protein